MSEETTDAPEDVSSKLESKPGISAFYAPLIASCVFALCHNISFWSHILGAQGELSFQRVLFLSASFVLVVAFIHLFLSLANYRYLLKVLVPVLFLC